MNLFLIGWRADGGLCVDPARPLVEDLLAQLPSPKPSDVQTWGAPSGRVVVVCASHPPELVGGVSYSHFESDRMALFSGRPFRWTGDQQADGRGPLDPRYYLRPAREWIDELDGRYVAARYDDRDGLLELCADALGAYPLYRGGAAETSWFSNNAWLVRRALGEHATGAINRTTAAGLVADGCSPSLSPIWADLERVPRGLVLAIGGRRGETSTQQLPLAELAAWPGSGFDPQRAARLLAAATAALADWPGRPVTLQLSGGRDSRLLLATAARIGIECRAVTHGADDDPDVVVARRAADTAGVTHEFVPAGDPDAAIAALLTTARLLALTGGGGISLADAAGYFATVDGPLPLWLNGQGGETARVYYGVGTRPGMLEWLLTRIAPSADLLSQTGRRLLETAVAGALGAELEAGASVEDVLDVYFVERRTASWAGVGHGCAEYVKGDTVSPLWSRRVIAQQLAAPIGEREAALFQRATLAQLCPPLAELEYAVGGTPRPLGSFGAVIEAAREALSDPRCDSLWELLDSDAVGRLLAADPETIDARTRRPVWRLLSAATALTL
jgi:hypothetical protein